LGYEVACYSGLGALGICGLLRARVVTGVAVLPLLAGVPLVLLLVGATTPDYRALAAPGLAYLCIHGSLVLGRSPRLRLRNDLSYGTYVYGFPLQQALLMSGVRPSWPVFTALSIAITVAMAALSWRFVERPTLAGRHPAGRLAPAGRRPARFTATS
jgi:peptidoglycan/LPS O-acetylase OafA/YrhL